MCGIAGLVRWSALRPDEAGIGARMADCLHHRGPDAAGLHEDAWTSFGHRRLSVIDPAGGHQPLSNEDGSVWVVFNGEIYNHLELRSGLEARGHRLGGRSDTEVIPHLYEELGEDFVHRLNGMFAIALWDACKRQLLLVRDRLGVKPLYWHDDGRRILFGSELKALLAAGDVDPRVDLCGLADYLTFGHVPAPRTLFESVRKLEPGHLAVCREGGVRVRRYWEIPAARPSEDAPPHPGPSVEAFAALLEDAVRIRMIADVPLGAFLSGGLDSAAVVAAMTRSGAPRVLTHTMGFSQSALDEREPARQTAALLGTEHYEMLDSSDVAETALHLAWHFDEPLADACAIPTFLLCQATRRRVTVALAGDGADELLGGYRRYRFSLGEERWRTRLPGFLKQVPALLGAAYPKADWLPRPLRARVTLQNLACDAVHAHLRSTALHCGAMLGRLLHPELQHQLWEYCPFERRLRMARDYDSDDLLGRLLYLDSRTLLPDRMLTKVDRASMAVGLEVREPFLDYRLVELAARTPAALRVDKQIVRETLRRWRLDPIVDRPKKGFEVPLDAWFRGPLRSFSHDLLTAADARVTEWLEPAAVRHICARHDGGWSNFGDVLWALLSLELWARRIHDPAAARRRECRSDTSSSVSQGSAA